MAEGKYSTTDYKSTAYNGEQDTAVTGMPAPEMGVEGCAAVEERAAVVSADESTVVKERAVIEERTVVVSADESTAVDKSVVADEGTAADENEAASTTNENSKTDSAEKQDRKKRSGALVIVLVVLAFLAIAAGSYILICGIPLQAPEVSKEKENSKTQKDPGISNPEKKQTDKDIDKDTCKENNEDNPDDKPAEDPKEDPNKDPDKDPNGTGENVNGNNGNGNGSNGGTGQVWHPAWDEWVVVGYYETRYIEHPATYKEVFHPEVGHYGTVCNTCGAELGPGEGPQHLVDNLHASYRTAYIVDSPAWIEYVLVTAAWIEAVQVWIDTSHWVRHEGYWQ